MAERVWQAVKRPTFYLWLSGPFFSPSPPWQAPTCAVDKPRARAAQSCSLTCPPMYCPSTPFITFRLLCCLLKCSHPSLRPSLFVLLLSSTLSLSLSLSFCASLPFVQRSLCSFGSYKAQLCLQGLHCLPNGWGKWSANLMLKWVR